MSWTVREPGCGILPPNTRAIAPQTQSSYVFVYSVDLLSYHPLLTGTVRVFPYLLLDCAQRLTENYIPSKSICIVKCRSMRLDNSCR